MVNKVPENWNYSESTEMLYLFYQISDELLSECTTDTYSLPLHNAITLSYEIKLIYNMLNDLKLLNEYYEKYIPIIIDEFLCSLKKDDLLKKELGLRLNSITTGLSEAKNNHKFLMRWIDSLHQICDIRKYFEIVSNEIENSVNNTKNKKELIQLTKDFYVTLINIGHSREFLYITVKRFFDNRKNTIDTNAKIKEFIQLFDCKEKELEFIILLDLNTIEYLVSISDNLFFM